MVGIVFFAMTLMLTTSGNPQIGVSPQFCAGAPAPVPTSGFPQPQVRRSLNGQLVTDLHACIATNVMLDENQIPPVTVQFNPPTLEGTIPGPTLSLKPGDQLLIRVLNNLPVNPANERGGAFPHNENTLNIHTHGLNEPRHDKLNIYAAPPESSVWHLLVPCAQAWIGDVSIPRRHGRFLDRPGRTGNPRHSA